MANEQYAVLKKSAVPTRDQWQAAIEACGGWHAVTRRSRGSACTPRRACSPEAARRESMPPCRWAAATCRQWGNNLVD